MGKELMTPAEARRHLYAGRLPLFEQIARGFLEIVSSTQKRDDVSDCLNYLDGTVKIDGTLRARRAVVLAIEELKQKIEAPLPLQSEARAQMSRLELEPVPELKLYRDVATAILRMDAALHFAKRTKAWGALERGPVYHSTKPDALTCIL